MQLRPDEPDDAMAVARVHVRSWQVAYRKLLPDDYLDQLRPEDRAKTYDFASLDPLKPRTVVTIEEGVILRFCHNDAVARRGSARARRSGARVSAWPLLSAARANLFEPGFRNALLWVLAGNVRAERFYRIDQWLPDGRRRTDSVWGVMVNEVRYQRRL